MKNFLFIFLIVICSAFAKAQSVNSAYLCLSNGDVVLADLSTCSTTVVASNNQSMFDIAEGDTADTLYGIRNDEIYLIDLTSGNFTLLGTLNIVGYSGSFRVDSLVKEQNGILLGVNKNGQGELFRINVGALTATNLGATGFNSAGDLSFFQGDLYLSATNSELVRVDINNPQASTFIGSMASSGFGSVFGVVTIITADPCAASPTIELVATGGRTTKFVNVANGNTTNNCFNLTNSDIFGAAEVTSDIICSIDLEIEDSNSNSSPQYCENATTILNAIVDPATPIGVYAYEWSIQGQGGVVGLSSILPININTSTTYNCIVTDSGRAAPDNIAVASFTVTVNQPAVWNPIPNIIAHSTYTLPTVTGSNIPANTAFYDNPAHTGAPWNTGDVVTPSMFATNPATIYVYGIDQNGCELIEQFDIEFVDVQVTITPGGIRDACDGEIVTLTATPNPANAYGNYTYNWNDSQNTVYPNTNTITVTLDATTTISVTVNDSGVENGFSMGFDMTDFTVIPAVDITDLANQNATGTFTFPVIAGTGLTGGEQYFTQPNGLGTAYNAGDIVSNTDFMSLPVTLYIYDSNGVCNDEESFILDFDTPVPLTLILNTSNNDFCAGENINLTATPFPTAAQGTYTYEWREQGTMTVLSTAATWSVSPNTTTTYECVVTDSGLTINNSVTDSITINVIAVPVLDGIINQNVTGTFTFPVITGTNLTGNERYYTQSNGMGTVYNAGDTVSDVDFTTLPVTLFIYDANGICNDQETFTLDFDTPLPLTLSIIPNPATICEGETTILTAMVSPIMAQGAYQYEWVAQGSATILSTTNTLTIAPNLTTIYECTVTDTGLTLNNTVTATATINVDPVPQIDALSDQNILDIFIFPIITGTTLSGNEMYFTSPNGQGRSFNAGDTVGFSDFTDYPVTLYIYDVNSANCSDQESFSLVINEQVLFIIPDYMTPNDDGFHDYWQIEVLQPNLFVSNIFVFDRYGKLLKQLSPDGPGWDATYNNQPLPSATYWYSFEYVFNGESSQSKGFFAVKR